jgi:hypothetical protein
MSPPQIIIYIETTDDIEVIPVGYIILLTDAQLGSYHNRLRMTKLCFYLYSFSSKKPFLSDTPPSNVLA